MVIHLLKFDRSVSQVRILISFLSLSYHSDIIASLHKGISETCIKEWGSGSSRSHPSDLVQLCRTGPAPPVSLHALPDGRVMAAASQNGVRVSCQHLCGQVSRPQAPGESISGTLKAGMGYTEIGNPFPAFLKGLWVFKTVLCKYLFKSLCSLKRAGTVLLC